jgi:DNA-binding beta-propeller fold protein YncE
MQSKECNMRRHRHRQIFSTILVVLSALCALLPAAATAVELPSPLWQVPEDGDPGTGAGRIDNPWGIAADPTTGHVYVSDLANNRIDEFTSWGGFVKAFGWGVADGTSEELQTCATTCFRGLEGSGPGQLKRPTGIAVDSSGDVYVFGWTGFQVQKFDPTTGPEEKEAEFLLTFGGDVNKTKAEEPGSTEAERNLCTAASGDVCQAGTAGVGKGQFSEQIIGNFIALSPGGDLYVADRGGEGGTRARIQAFAANGEFKSQFDLPPSGYTGELNNNPGSLTVDPSNGSLYFAFRQGRSFVQSPEPNVYKLSPAGAVLGILEVDTPTALAADADGNVYVVEGGYPSHPNSEVLKFDSSGKPVIPLGSHFAEPKFGVSLNGLAANVIAPGSKAPGDLYVSSFKDAAESFITAYGPPEEFELPPKVPPQITDQYAASVDPEGALVKGRINPHFWKDTTYFVEYGTGKCSEGGCTSTQPVAPGTTLTPKLVSSALPAGAFLTGLAPRTTYHYRLVALSGGSEGVPVRGVGGKPGIDGVEASFTTPALPTPPPSPDPCANAQFRSGASALLPDCRAYEMVSPLDKDNGDVITQPFSAKFRARLDQSAASGEALTFSSYRAFAGAQAGAWSTQYLAEREGGGWSTQAISPPKSGEQLPGGSVNSNIDTIFRAFSADLGSAWITDDFGPALDPAVPGTFTNIFRRDNASGAYEAQIRALPPHSDASSRNYPELQGVSADGSHALFRIEDNLTPDAPELTGAEEPPHQLYESYREGEGPPQLRLVSVLPGGAPAEAGVSAGIANGLGPTETGRVNSLAHAISADGSRIYWTAADQGPGKIYLRAGGEETLPVSEATSPVDTSPARFWIASADGSRALFAFTAGPKAGDLYQYDAEKGKAKRIAHKAIGLLGASEDLSRIYFLGEEALTEGATEGKPNLYLDEEGSFTFIGGLSAADAETSPGHNTPVNVKPFWHAARVTPDGGALAFMSSSPELAEAVAGYDNTDQASGKADAEVYRYEAQSGKLACASCNPTGARPLGSTDPLHSDAALSAAAALPNADAELYQQRYLSGDGQRLFFTSYEPLLPRDTDGAADVYQWEAPGNGDCTEASPAFSAPSEGCLSLISTGQSPRDSEFIDASPDGKDVFFATLSSLVSQDSGLVDIYDARAGGGFAPPPPPPGPCEGEACQGSAPTRNDATPASAGYEGPGNAADKPNGRCRAGKVRRKGRCVARKHRGDRRHSSHKRNTH